MKKKFNIEQQFRETAYGTNYYEGVEAESLEEAIRMVEEDLVMPYHVELHEWDNFEILDYDDSKEVKEEDT